MDEAKSRENGPTRPHVGEYPRKRKQDGIIPGRLRGAGLPRQRPAMALSEAPMKTPVIGSILGTLTAVLLSLGGTSWAQDAAVPRILEKLEKARPADADMGFYRLDWSGSLTDAKRRARKEGRPILFIWLTNKTGPTDFFTGHC